MTAIVVVNVSQQIAPTPSILQRTGALLSQGGTLTSPGTKTLLTQLSDLTPWLKGALALTGITQSAGLATAVATAPHGFTVGDEVELTIAGATGATTAYNGTFLCTVTTANNFTFAVPGGTASPATGTLIYTPEDVAELMAMATTFFAQGTAASVYVLELGPGVAIDGVSYLNTWIQNNGGIFYSYLVPREWDSDPSFLAFLAQFENTTAKTYFFVTTTLSTYQNYTNLMKCVVALIECPVYGAWPTNPLTAATYSAGWGANAFTALHAGGIGVQFATATTTTAHGVLPGQVIVVSGCTPAGYNGTFIAASGTTGSTLIYALPGANPGPETVLGTLNASPGGAVSATTTTPHLVVPGDVFTIAGMVPTGYNGTFIAQAGTTGSTLVYDVPAALGAESSLGTLISSGYSSAGIPASEFSHAADFYVSLNYNPSSVNKVTPFNLSFLFGVTPFPTQGNSAILQLLQNANINIVGTGAAGGISNTLLSGGNNLDGNPFNYWYSVDWVQINVALNVTNAVINGSNNPVNPLYLNQDGINALQGVAGSTMNSAVTFGLALGSVSQTELNAADFQAALAAGAFAGNVCVNAVPFAAYYSASEGDFKIGKYAGFTIIYTPLRGFALIVFNVIVTQFVAAP